MVETGRIVLFVLSFLELFLSTSSVIILVSSQKIKQARYKQLVLYLSITDIVFVTEISVVVLLDELDFNGQMSIPCDVLRCLSTGTYLFTFFQCLFICLERLNSTFAQRSKCLQMCTSNKAILIFFILTHIYGFLPFLTNYLMDDKTAHVFSNGTGREFCGTIDVNVSSFILYVDIPSALLFISFIASYVIVIIRVFKVLNKNPGSSVGNGAKHAKRTSVTVGIFIVITALLFLPRTIVRFASLCTGQTQVVETLLSVFNGLVLLNPLIDVIIYVVRVKEFRARLVEILCLKKENIVQPIHDNFGNACL